MSRRSRSTAADAGGVPPESSIPAEPPKIPRMETPSNEIGLHNIWRLLRNMQEQILSLQEQVTNQGHSLDAVENQALDLDGHVGEIRKDIAILDTTTNKIWGAIEKGPRTPPPMSLGGAEQTPRPGLFPAPSILSPTARRTARASFLKPKAEPREPAGDSSSSEDEVKPSRKVRAPKMKEPEPFDGTKGRAARQWGTKALIWGKVQLPNYQNDEEAVVTRLLMLMKPGKAADWAQPHLERIMGDVPGAWKTLQEFGTAFRTAFIDPDAARAAARQIEALQQTGDIADYNTEFDNLRADLKWNEEALISQYECGLQHRIKAQLTLKDPYPAMLLELQSIAMKIGQIFKELDTSRPPKASGSKEKGKGREAPATTTSTRAPNPNYVDAEEQDKCRAKGLCIKCGAPDHQYWQC